MASDKSTLRPRVLPKIEAPGIPSIGRRPPICGSKTKPKGEPLIDQGVFGVPAAVNARPASNKPNARQIKKHKFERSRVVMAISQKRFASNEAAGRRGCRE